jgi:DNA-binding MarR family transcriptional regulator
MPAFDQSHMIQPDNTAHLLSKARRAINAHLVNEMAKAGIIGIVPSHGDIIATLLRRESMTMRELSDAIQRDPSTVTTLVKKLAQMGFVSLEDNPRDTRSRLVSLTPQGRALEEQFHPISVDLTRTIWHGINDTEREQFRDTLQKIIQNFQP